MICRQLDPLYNPFVYQVDKRKGGQLDKDAVKKARLEQTATSHDHVLPRFTNKPATGLRFVISFRDIVDISLFCFVC